MITFKSLNLLNRIGISLLALLVLSHVNTSVGEAQVVSIADEIADEFDELPKISDPGEPVTLEWKIQSDQVLRYQTESTAEIDVMGLVMPKVDRNTIQMKFKDVTMDGYSFESRYESYFSSMKSPNGSYVVDTENPRKEVADPALRPMQQLLKGVATSLFEGRCDSNGKMVEYDVPRKIRKLTKNDAYKIRPDDLCAGFISSVMEMPAGPVSVGDEWKTTPPIESFGIKDYEMIATFLGVTEVDNQKCAVIQARYDAQAEEIRDGITDVEYSVVSLVIFDLEAGNILRTYSSGSNEMVMEMAGNEIAQLTIGKTIVNRIDD